MNKIETNLIDFVNDYMWKVENKSLVSLTDEEKEIIKSIMKILNENKVTVIRATTILDFCKDVTKFSKVG